MCNATSEAGAAMDAEVRALRAAQEASDAELIKYIDLYIFMERDRDQCARERDAYKAERDALAARVAAYEAALGPAWDADEGATAGEWRYHPNDSHYSNAPHMVWGFDGPGYGTLAETCSPGMLPYPGGEQAANARLIAAAVNAVRAARAVSNA